MLKLKVELDLGNEAMLSLSDVVGALQRAHGDEGALVLIEGDGGVLRDENGNRVGVWGVEDTRGTNERGPRTYRESAYDRSRRLDG